MAEFAYNNAKNASTSHMLFKLNFDYHSCIFSKKNLNTRFKFKPADKQDSRLKKLITLY